MKTGINSDLESTSNILVSLNLKFTISLILSLLFFQEYLLVSVLVLLRYNPRDFFLELRLLEEETGNGMTKMGAVVGLVH